jgi:hypothetical protein
MTVIEPPQVDPPEGEKTPKANEENIKKLREQAEAGNAAIRENAMLKAGINTETPLGKFFAESYKGDLTKEAVIAAATEIGVLEKTTTNPQVSEEERKSTQERQNLTTGAADPSQMPTKHPREQGLENAKMLLDKGGTYEQAGAAFLTTLVKAIDEGDERAIYKKEQGSGGTQRV